MEEYMNDNTMEETTPVVEDTTVEEQDTYYPVAQTPTGTSDDASGPDLVGAAKLLAIAAGGAVLVKKFIWDKRIKPKMDEKKAAKKAEQTAEEEAKFEAWAIKKGLIVPVDPDPADPPTTEEVQDIPEETTEKK